MIRPTLLLAACAAALCACQPEPSSEPPPAAPGQVSPPAPTGGATPSPPPAPEPLAAALVLAEWRKAQNRATCAPLAFTSDGGTPATARRAQFSGGWAVAFDTAGVRSAYGLAGVGSLAGDGDPPAEHERRLRDQWPQFMTLPHLPAPAFAGYGLEGAAPYPDDDPEGRRGHTSLAYLRVGGQGCDYNVWSRLGRAHLEALLASLRPL